MSQAVVHGSTVYLAGTVADKAKGESVGEQTREILDRSSACSAKPDRTRRRSVRDHLARRHQDIRRDERGMGRVGPQDTPARATVEAKLAAPPYTVEIACIAATGWRGSARRLSRSPLELIRGETISCLAPRTTTPGGHSRDGEP